MLVLACRKASAPVARALLALLLPEGAPSTPDCLVSDDAHAESSAALCNSFDIGEVSTSKGLTPVLYVHAPALAWPKPPASYPPVCSQVRASARGEGGSGVRLRRGLCVCALPAVAPGQTGPGKDMGCRLGRGRGGEGDHSLCALTLTLTLCALTRPPQVRALLHYKAAVAAERLDPVGHSGYTVRHATRLPYAITH